MSNSNSNPPFGINPVSWLVDATIKLGRAVKGNVIGTTVAFLMVLTFVGVASLNNSFTRHNPTLDTEQSRFSKTLEIDNQVNAMLDRTREELNSDRLLIRQMHNGRMDLARLPFMSISTTYASIRPGVAFGNENFAAVPLSTLNEVLNRMWGPANGNDFADGSEMISGPRCTKVTVDELKNVNFRGYLEHLGVEIVYLCPVQNLNGAAIGVVAASYLDKYKIRPSDDEIMKTLRDVSIRTAGYLDRVTQDEESWIDKVTSLIHA